MTDHLSDPQIARAEALEVASKVGRKSAGPLGSSTPPDILDLVNLAEYIVTGTHPMDRYNKETPRDRDA